MKIDILVPEFEPVPGAVIAWRAEVDAATWRLSAHQVWEHGGRLIALWAADTGRSPSVHLALVFAGRLLWLSLPVKGPEPEYPDLSDLFPAAARMQRAVFDLVGIRARGDLVDKRRWLRHGAWPVSEFPLRRGFDAGRRFDPVADDYAFVRVAGDGVHEIAVGPVHAGAIEPGHFRFSVVGERVLRLEERLGYAHKGIEKRFETLGVHDGYRLAGRVSGDSTVAYAWAYSMAAEAAAGLTPPPRALWLRALWLERERIANHLGDLGHIGNDAGLGFALAQFSRLKEDWLRSNQYAFGHRYLMDRVLPGGAAVDLADDAMMRMRDDIVRVRGEIARLRVIFDEHPGLQDRLVGTGRVTRELGERLGMTGLAARASGMPLDLRSSFPCAPYDALQPRMVVHEGGDVAARTALRFDEVIESLQCCGRILDGMPEGNIATLYPTPEEGAVGIGWVEGWRGDILIALETGSNGALRRVHPHDPSWRNWPVLEHAIIGNIVPDFPLINKSFNLSYSGQDL
ncbi:MAG: NADH-quinone oxidoreductase subunit C [Burkholderiales bacterium]|nr:NADH-quinone oxidoreductase subunit C [Burkholderiales bacterium]